LVSEKRLGEIKASARRWNKKSRNWFETGKLKYYDELKASIPPGFLEMLEIFGVGPKKIQTLHKKLGLIQLKNWRRPANREKSRNWMVSAKKRRANILEESNGSALTRGKHRAGDALKLAEPLLENCAATHIYSLLILHKHGGSSALSLISLLRVGLSDYVAALYYCSDARY